MGSAARPTMRGEVVLVWTAERGFLMRNRPSLMLGLALVLVLLASSCGGAASDGQTLDEVMGWDDFDEQGAHQAYVELSTEAQEMVADCMAGKGLEYTVWEPPQGFTLEDLPGDEFLLRYGYGFFAVMLEDYRYRLEHAEELAEENPNEAVHAQQAPESVDYMAAWVECGDLADEALLGWAPTPDCPTAASPTPSGPHEIIKNTRHISRANLVTNAPQPATLDRQPSSAGRRPNHDPSGPHFEEGSAGSVDVGAMIDVDHSHRVICFVDLVDDPVGADTCGVESG